MTAVAALLLTGAAACGSPAGGGDPEPAVDLARLDPGPYASQPKPFHTNDPRFVAGLFEAERMASYIPLPHEIDPALKYNNTRSTQVFAGGNRTPVGMMYEWAARDPIDHDTHGLIGAFSSTGMSDEDYTALGYTVSNTVFLYPDADSASAAATEMAQAGFEPRKGPAQPAQLPRHPDVRAAWLPGQQVLTAWYPTGRFVLATVVYNQENQLLQVSDLPALEAPADRSLDAIPARLKDFPATPPDRLGAMALDPDGMLARSLVRPQQDDWTSMPGVYDARGDLQLEADPDRYARVFAESGIDRVAYAGGTLVRARDYRGAQRFVMAESQDEFLRRQASPRGLPAAVCVKDLHPTFGLIPYYCRVAHDRYAATVWSDQLLDAQQRIAAQYARLVRSK
ncbi:hypothetical protein KO481_41550 [Nocardia sp. NEAU-G5]|uniref:Lipoprotein n=1 Tax=Nocardia albiluteola TaxID=2842303 RepID=A0ABS6BCG8_9NOCA|nr:hypothetical protein [Nocardia albiluteola]MBU3067987.1 hypothetical protein [Nocardia albiluteola]